MDNKKLSKFILKFLIASGVLMVTVAAPKAGVELMKMMEKNGLFDDEEEKQNKRKFQNAFYYLKKKGLIYFDYHDQQLHISLTEDGKKLAGKYRINDLKIKKPKKWDKKWRILIFDIEDKQKIKREALRGKLKELDMFQWQKSVWVYPYDFKREITLLREFFGFANDEIKIIEASKIENDDSARKFFGLN